MHSAALAISRSVRVKAKYSGALSFIRLTFYICNNSSVSSEHGLEPLSESDWLFTLVHGKNLLALMRFIHLSAVEFADA